MTPEERAKKALAHNPMMGSTPVEVMVAHAIREAEQSAFERAAKVADNIVQDELKRRDGTEDEDFVSSAESRRVTAAYIAQSIRDLGKQKA